MNNPTQETTMTTTPTGLITNEMVDAAMKARHQHSVTSDGWPIVVRAMLAAAMLAAPPTTPEPDGLAGRIERLEQYDSIAFQRHGETAQRLIAHDAALAELRDGFDMLTSRVTTHGRRLDRVDPLPSIEDMRGILSPAMPDAVEDERWGRVAVEYDAAYAEANDFEDCHDERSCIAGTKAAVAKAAALGLTPAPPPLVVSDEMVSMCFKGHWERNNYYPTGSVSSTAIRHILNYAADHWTIPRVPAGDDQGDTQGEER